MNNYIKLNEDRWNNVKNDYTEPLTHEECRKHQFHYNCWGKSPHNGLKKARKRYQGQLVVVDSKDQFCSKGYDVTIMDFLNHNYKGSDMVC